MLKMTGGLSSASNACQPEHHLIWNDGTLYILFLKRHYEKEIRFICCRFICCLLSQAFTAGAMYRVKICELLKLETTHRTAIYVKWLLEIPYVLLSNKLH